MLFAASGERAGYPPWHFSKAGSGQLRLPSDNSWKERANDRKARRGEQAASSRGVKLRRQALCGGAIIARWRRYSAHPHRAWPANSFDLLDLPRSSCPAIIGFKSQWPLGQVDQVRKVRERDQVRRIGRFGSASSHILVDLSQIVPDPDFRISEQQRVERPAMQTLLHFWNAQGVLR